MGRSVPAPRAAAQRTWRGLAAAQTARLRKWCRLPLLKIHKVAAKAVARLPKAVKKLPEIAKAEVQLYKKAFAPTVSSSEKWDTRFLGLADFVALWSKCQGIDKIGCIIVGKDREIRSTGYNGFPRGVADDSRMDPMSATSADLTCHAAENAIMHAARIGVSVKDCEGFVSAPPCTRCARSLIQAGVTSIVLRRGETNRCAACDDADLKLSMAMLREAGVRVRTAGWREGTVPKAGDDTSTPDKRRSKALEVVSCQKQPRYGSWSDRFLALSTYIAQWSKDPSTIVGCVIVGKDKEIRSTGFNGLPRGIEDTKERLEDRSLKYPLICHAEENAIMHAARIGVSVKDCEAFVTWPPCARCARSLVQAGIRRVVYPDGVRIREAWASGCKAAVDMMTEAGVEVVGSYHY
mmetsp:Transcript_10417/g.18739  ORF Transcript_10417/g.18739 Transcript_10417/m.18739 type:complete len:407 (-) Transcript_10417:3-1223(-)